jgi:hypothetical protein
MEVEEALQPLGKDTPLAHRALESFLVGLDQ